MTKSHKVKLVIASNYNQYKFWYEWHKRLKGYENCKYISSIEQLYGYGKDVGIVLAEQYWLSPVFNDRRFEIASNKYVIIKSKVGDDRND